MAVDKNKYIGATTIQELADSLSKYSYVPRTEEQRRAQSENLYRNQRDQALLTAQQSYDTNDLALQNQLTGLGTATTASAVTEYGAPSSDTFAKTVAVTSQPSVTLTSGDSSSSGSVSYVSAVGTSGTDAVNFDTSTSGHTADAITALGTATAAAQTITVGNNDKVVAVTDIGTGTAEGQAFTGTTETYAVYPTEE